MRAGFHVNSRVTHVTCDRRYIRPGQRSAPRLCVEPLQGSLSGTTDNRMVRAGCPRLPLAYFDQRVVAPIGWASGSNAYLAFVSMPRNSLAAAVKLGPAGGMAVTSTAPTG